MNKKLGYYLLEMDTANCDIGSVKHKFVIAWSNKLAIGDGSVDVLHFNEHTKDCN